MFDDVVLTEIRTALRANADFVALVGRTEDIDISRDGRPNPACGGKFCGLYANSQNVNPSQMAGVRMNVDISIVLSRKIEARPKDNDKEYMYGDGGALPKIERQLVRILHQSSPVRTAIRTSLRTDAETENLYPDIDGGIEYQGAQGGIAFHDADWFFGEAEYPMPERRRGVSTAYQVPDKGPGRSREYFGISRTHLFRMRIIVAHRHLRISPTP